MPRCTQSRTVTAPDGQTVTLPDVVVQAAPELESPAGARVPRRSYATLQDPVPELAAWPHLAVAPGTPQNLDAIQQNVQPDGELGVVVVALLSQLLHHFEQVRIPGSSLRRLSIAGGSGGLGRLLRGLEGQGLLLQREAVHVGVQQAGDVDGGPEGKSVLP